MGTAKIPFTRVSITDRERRYVREALDSGELAGDGVFTKRCEQWLQQTLGCARALLTSSGTAALEMAALLAEVGPGDEVIMPSFTFSSTANAFLLRGAVPVFVEIDSRTLNIDPATAADAITPKTRAIVAVHYAGVPADLDALRAIADRANATLIEDAAQSLWSKHGDRFAGTYGDTAAVSFHQTKNVTSGEGGALLINDPELIERAEIIREKGTNRSRFYRGEIDKYTWIDIGSSYVPGELIAAFLLAQLERSQELTERRLAIWDHYHASLEALERSGDLVRPQMRGNGHIYYVLLRSEGERAAVIDRLRERGISAVFHYVPLHGSPAGLRYGRTPRPLPVTESISKRLLRLPLWPDLTEAEADSVVEVLGAQSLSSTAMPKPVRP